MKYLCDNCSPKIGCTNRFENKKTECDSYVPMNNEQFIRFCNTEQLAEWIASVVQKAISIKKNNGIVMLESAIWWDEWLKQPHTTKE